MNNNGKINNSIKNTIKNKKHLNIIVAIFMVFFVSGGAFAFAAAGPLMFEGEANVTAALEMSIVSGEVAYTTGVPEAAVGTYGAGVQELEFAVNFDAPSQSATFNFEIQNTGTMNAQIFDVENVVVRNIAVDGVNQYTGSPDYIAFQNNLTVDWRLANNTAIENIRGSVYKPTESQGIMVTVDLDASVPDTFTGTHVQGSAIMTLTLVYGLPR